MAVKLVTLSPHSRKKKQRRKRKVLFPPNPLSLFVSPSLSKAMIIFPFQNLEIYKKAQLFHIGCKEILSKIKAEKYAYDQLGRASYSIVLNIAEGSAKTSHAERRNYFTTARGSTFECVAILDLLILEKVIDLDKYEELLQLADEISRLLYSMIKNLAQK